MKISLAVNILKNYGPLQLGGYKIFHLVRSLAENQIICSEWCNYKSYYSSPDIAKEAPCEDCVEILFSSLHNKLFVRIEMYEGDSFSGYRNSEKRCEFSMILSSVPDFLDPYLLERVSIEAENDITSEDHLKWRKRIALRSEQILKDLGL